MMRIRTQIWLKVFVLLAALVFCSCGGGGGDEEDGVVASLGPAFQTATTSDLENRSFRFPANAGLFDSGDPRQGQAATLTIGSFHTDNNSAGFTLVTEDGSLEGGVLLLSSSHPHTTTMYLHLAGQEPQMVTEPLQWPIADDYFLSCEIDSQGRLGLIDADGEITMVSEPYTILTADLDNTVYLSPPSGSGRPENGTTEWQLFGNVLSFTVTVNDLGPGDRLSYGHVHTNGPAEDDPRLLTLFGDPIDPVRSYEPPFPSGAAITASIFLTPDEVSALSDPGNLCYIDVHFKNGGNLVEGAGPI